MTFVECEHIQGIVALRQHDIRCVSQPQSEIRVALDHAHNFCHIGLGERLQLVRAPAYLTQQRDFRVSANPSRQQIVQFRQNKRREQQPTFVVGERFSGRRVEPLGSVQGGE